MKTISKIALISVVIILSCASCKSTSFYTYTSRSEKINSVQLQATTTLVDIDVDFQHRVTAESGWCLNEKNAKDEALYNARPDLMLCNRTVIGHTSAKDQQLEDHYFGAIHSK